MDLSHISQDKILPEVDLVSHEDVKSKTFSSNQDLEVFQSLRKHYWCFFYSVWCQVLNMVQVQVVSDVVTVLLACWHSENLDRREFAYSCDLVMTRSNLDDHGCDRQTMQCID